jgi:hypothetical protein
MQTIVQIFKINEQRTGSKEGRAWAMQDAECALLDESGAIQQIGVLQLPKDMQGEKAPKPGVYMGSFSLRAGLRDRRIEAVLAGLTLIPNKAAQRPVGAS